MKKVLALLLASLFIGGAVHTASAFDGETLADKLAGLFKGLTPDQIDSAVADAKSKLAAKQTTQDLDLLFDSQIATLKERGLPWQIVEDLRDQKAAVLEKARATHIGDGHIPFLPVIPRSYRGVHDLMEMVIHGNDVGRVYLDPTEIFDLVGTPKRPYFIYDVEDGSRTLDKSVDKAREIFTKEKRSGLTVAEVIALAVHTDVLLRHNVWAAGSRHGAGSVAYLWLSVGGPELVWSVSDLSDSKWGSASCGSR